MKQQTFESLHEERWRRFETSLGSVANGYRLAKQEDSEDFVADYQAITHALALAKHRGYSRLLVERLNDLVVRGHSVMYARRSGFFPAVLGFVLTGFPRAVRREWMAVLVSAMCFLVPLVGIGFMVSHQPEWVYSVMDAGTVDELEAMYNPASEHFGRERASDTDFKMFGFYVFNNIGISFRVFASGLLFGLGTIAQLVINGVYIGAAFGHMWVVGFQETFHAFVIGHGAFELTAIVLAGAAGLLLGQALVAPGKLSRRTALRVAGHRAIRIVFGSTLMLLIAAFIEAFWSSSSTVPAMVKFTVGGALWVFVLGYLTFAGRRFGSD